MPCRAMPCRGGGRHKSQAAARAAVRCAPGLVPPCGVNGFEQLPLIIEAPGSYTWKLKLGDLALL